MIGYVTVIIQVQQRRKDALLLIGDEGAAASESSLQQLVSRYRFLDLWPCSSQDLDYLARQQVCIIARLLGMNNNNNNNHIYIVE